MTGAVTLGVDVGTGSVKTAAVEVASGRLVASSEVTHATHRPRPGIAEQDADGWYRAACEGIRGCLGDGAIDPGDVVALAVDGPAHNVALLDDRDRALRPVIHWSDTRAGDEADRLAAELGDEVHARTLHRPKASWTLAQLAWVRDHEPGTWRRLRRFAVTKDLVRLRLTGRHATDPYDALGTQLYDAVEHEWSPRLLEWLGWGDRDLPPVRAATDEGGTITSAAARDTGLLAGTRVAVGSSDTLSEAHGVGVDGPGHVLLKLGSSANVLAVSTAPHTADGVLTYPHLAPGAWIQVTATSSGAATARWFREGFLGADADDYDLLEAMAARAPAGAAGLLFHPFLAGERSPMDDPQLRGSFTGISSAHTADHFARALLEGVACSMRHCLESVASLVGTSTAGTVVLIGGGARNALWCQVVADVMGLPLQRVVGPAAAYGAALLAAESVGAEVPTARPRDPGLRRQDLQPRSDERLTHETLYRRYLAAVDPITRISRLD